MRLTLCLLTWNEIGGGCQMDVTIVYPVESISGSLFAIERQAVMHGTCDCICNRAPSPFTPAGRANLATAPTLPRVQDGAQHDHAAWLLYHTRKAVIESAAEVLKFRPLF
jgi:hypothetical protein